MVKTVAKIKRCADAVVMLSCSFKMFRLPFLFLLTRWWFQLFFIFTPQLGKKPFWRAYLSNGLVVHQPLEICWSTLFVSEKPWGPHELDFLRKQLGRRCIPILSSTLQRASGTAETIASALDKELIVQKERMWMACGWVRWDDETFVLDVLWVCPKIRSCFFYCRNICIYIHTYSLLT